jgi:hypothetical protein
MRPFRLSSSSGQSLVEFTFLLPLLLVLAFGVIEAGWALLDQHVVARLTREGANLISRDVSLEQAATFMTKMTTRPVMFDDHSKAIFSVIKRVSTTGSTNYDKVVLFQRHEVGTFSSPSALRTSGPASFGSPPDYMAPNADNNSNLRITNLPANVVIPLGGRLYVAEVYSAHTLLTPLNNFGITFPQTLQSIAYF